jgi:hypothetical protein
MPTPHSISQISADNSPFSDFTDKQVKVEVLKFSHSNTSTSIQFFGENILPSSRHAGYNLSKTGKKPVNKEALIRNEYSGGRMGIGAVRDKTVVMIYYRVIFVRMSILLNLLILIYYFRTFVKYEEMLLSRNIFLLKYPSKHR